MEGREVPSGTPDSGNHFPGRADPQSAHGFGCR